MIKTEITDAGVFVAKKDGICLKISVPAKTANEWGSKTEFLDLPMMDLQTYVVFIKTLSKFRKMYFEE